MGGDTETSEDVASYIPMPRFYRTPELVRIARRENVELTAASDIYQLGLVLYRSLTGFNPQRPPKDHTDDIELDVRPILGAGGARLDELLQRMLRDSPSERPSSAGLLQDLNLIHREVCEADFNATGMMR
jgi:serine/threonine protein kinase